MQNNSETNPTIFDEILLKLDHLQTEFAEKLKYDTHKDAVIDKLHAELQSYKEDFLRKLIQPIFEDIISIIDSSEKLVDPSLTNKISHKKALQLLTMFSEDLLYLLEKHGIKKMNRVSQKFDPAKQRVIKKIPISSEAQDRTIYRCVHQGYEWEDGVVLRRELVDVFVYCGDKKNHGETIQNAEKKECES